MDIIYNETAGQAGNNLGVCLGGGALAYRAGMGAGSDLAVLCLLMFVFRLAKALLAARDTGHIMRTCVSEHPALYYTNCHPLDYR